MKARRRIERLESVVFSSCPELDWPMVVQQMPSSPNSPPGRWVRRDSGATEILVFDATQPVPEVAYPGNPLVVTLHHELGEMDPPIPLKLDPWLERRCRFVPD